MKRFVDIETPYSGENENEIRRNLLYARACVRDSLLRGEIPFASHLFFTQPGILDDRIQNERDLGINAGKELIESLPEVVTVVYHDLGTSKGMELGIKRALKMGRSVEYRLLGEWWDVLAMKKSCEHSHGALWGFKGYQCSCKCP